MSDRLESSLSVRKTLLLWTILIIASAHCHDPDCLIWKHKVLWHDLAVVVIIRLIPVKRNLRTCMEIVRVNFWNRVIVSRKNFLRWVKIWNEMEKSLIQGRGLQYFPASQPSKYFVSLEGTFFSAREHLSNQFRQIAQECRFSTSQETISAVTPEIFHSIKL